MLPGATWVAGRGDREGVGGCWARVPPAPPPAHLAEGLLPALLGRPCADEGWATQERRDPGRAGIEPLAVEQVGRPTDLVADLLPSQGPLGRLMAQEPLRD